MRRATNSRYSNTGQATGESRRWQDANQDGISQAGELKTLAALDIQSIATNDRSDARWAQENYISNVATYTRVGGETREIADAHFLNDNVNTWQLGAHSQVYGADVRIDLDAIMLPLSRGYGSLPSLHLAMSKSEALHELVDQLASLKVDPIGAAAAQMDAQTLSLRIQRKVGAGGTAGNDREWRNMAMQNEKRNVSDPFDAGHECFQQRCILMIADGIAMER